MIHLQLLELQNIGTGITEEHLSMPANSSYVASVNFIHQENTPPIIPTMEDECSRHIPLDSESATSNLNSIGVKKRKHNG